KISANSELDEVTAQTDELIRTMNENPDISKKNLLGAFLPNNGMIQVVSKDGEYVQGVQKPIDQGDLPLTYHSKEVQEIKKNKSGKNVAFVSKPVVWDNNELVTIQVSKQLLTLEETMNTLLYVLIFASIVMVIFAIIGGAVLGKVLLQPIQTLIQTMRRNTEQEKWEKLPVHGRSQDELF